MSLSVNAMSTKEELPDYGLPDDDDTRAKLSLLDTAFKKLGALGNETIRPTDFNQVDQIVLHGFMEVGCLNHHGKWLKMDFKKIQRQAGADA